ncbi:MAG: hypothetical protein WC767_02485 [Candidatus Paceibacterota bacterium]|jgi:hypothetical protein
MKKHLLFLTKAFVFALTFWFTIKVPVVDFSERYYGRNLGSVLVPLWTKVTATGNDYSLALPGENEAAYLRETVILGPERFKNTFGKGDTVWISFRLSGSRFLYRSDKGKTTFVSDEVSFQEPSGTSAAGAIVAPGGRSVRINLEPESIVWIALLALGWAVITFLICAVAVGIAMLLIHAVLDILKAHEENKIAQLKTAKTGT